MCMKGTAYPPSFRLCQVDGTEVLRQSVETV